MNMKTDHINNLRKVGGDYFILFNLKQCNIKLEEHLNKFNFDNYWCFKSTRHQKLISDIEEFKSFKYACYTFFRKDLYDKDLIIEWINWLIKYTGGIQYLVAPTPPFNPNKIIIRK